jgi:glutamate:GABA antiporter
LATAASAEFARAEAQAQTHSKALRKDLGLADLVLAQILMVIVPEFFGTAVKAGAGHVGMWLLAILLFFIPQVLVVSHLNRQMPLEGGLYEWTRLAFNDRVGFLVACNLWLSFVLQVAQIALVTTTYLAYAIGPPAAWIAANKGVLFGASLVLVSALIAVARLGLRVGKWVTNVGSVFTLITLIALVVMPFANRYIGKLPEYHPLPMAIPPLTLFSLSVFAKMTFGALSGFEYVAIFAGESRQPARNLARSVLFAAPIIAVLYVLGTGSILAFVSPDAVDIIGAIPQALSLGFQPFGLGQIIVPIVILLLLSNYLSSYAFYVSGSARLPMVAGWDHLLPEWFARLHSRYKTPVNSIHFVGGIAFVAGLAVLIGVGHQEAFALLQIWIWTCYAVAYLAMFAIPLVTWRRKGISAPWWLRLAAGSGFLVTLLFVLLSVFPIIPVVSQANYAVKTVAIVLGANCLALLLYRIGRQKHTSRHPHKH